MTDGAGYTAGYVDFPGRVTLYGSMLRRFLLMGRVTNLEGEIAGNRPRTDALLDALRTLSQRDPELAAVLKNFNL